jgi:hypothetical protein
MQLVGCLRYIFFVSVFLQMLLLIETLNVKTNHLRHSLDLIFSKGSELKDMCGSVR